MCKQRQNNELGVGYYSVDFWQFYMTLDLLGFLEFCYRVSWNIMNHVLGSGSAPVEPYFFQSRKLKQSNCRPGQALKFSEVEALRFQDNWHMKVVRLSTLRTGRLYPQETFLVLISVRVWVDPRAIVRPEGLCQWKYPMTPSGIEPATFWLVAQCLNQLRYRVPAFSKAAYTILWLAPAKTKIPPFLHLKGTIITTNLPTNRVAYTGLLFSEGIYLERTDIYFVFDVQGNLSHHILQTGFEIYRA